MKLVKVLIAFIIIIGTGIGVALLFLLNNEEIPTYISSATVIERRSAKEVIIRIKEKPEEEINDELTIYSNIFGVNDEVEVKYSKKREKYIVNKVIAKVDNNSKKSDLINKIAADPTIIKYTALIGNISKNTNIGVMPVELFGQEFELMSEMEFYNLKYGVNTVIEKDESITFTLLENFKVVSLENITNEQRIFLPYSLNNQTITFKGIGAGIYSLRLSYKNQDIINYIFA